MARAFEGITLTKGILACYNRPLNNPMQCPPHIRRELMPMVNMRFRHHKVRLGVPDHQIGIVTRSNAALLLQAKELRRVFAQQSRNILQRKAPLLRTRPERRQSELQARDTAPSLHEVATWLLLDVRRCRAVVAGYEVERAVLQRFPEQLVVRPLADRRCALELRGAIGDFLGAEHQVVRTGLGRVAR